MCEKCDAIQRMQPGNLPSHVELIVETTFEDGTKHRELTCSSVFNSGQLAVEVSGGAMFLHVFLKEITPGLLEALKDIIDGKILPGGAVPGSTLQ